MAFGENTASGLATRSISQGQAGRVDVLLRRVRSG